MPLVPGSSRWPAIVLGGAVVLCTAAAFTLVPFHTFGVRGAIFGVLLALACAGGLGAIAILVGSAVERLAGRAPAVAHGRAAALALALMFAGFGSAMLVVSPRHPLAWALAGHGGAVAALVWIGMGRLGARHRLQVLGAVLVAVTIARESGYVGVSMSRSQMHTSVDYRTRGDCGGHAVDGVAYDVDLDGNLGHRVRRWMPRPPAGSDVLAVEVRGHADTTFATCWIPLAKSARVTAHVELQWHVPGRCGGSATIELESERDEQGIQSCFKLRGELAREVAEEIDEHVHKVLR